MYCKNCGGRVHHNQAVCLRCGVKVGVGNRHCSYCGSRVNPQASVCLNCGVAIKNRAEADLNGKDKVTIAVVCFFLGGIGIHNFMMGETRKGIMKIVLAFLCGLSEIFALIDFIKILTDRYVADPTKLI